MNRMEKMLAQAKLGAGEGVLIHKPSNMFYLSGYTGEGLIAETTPEQTMIHARGALSPRFLYAKRPASSADDRPHCYLA